MFTGASSDAEGKKYWVEFDNAFGLVEGGDLKIGGVRAGTVNKFELTDTEPYKVLVEVEVAEPGFDALRTDSECRVRNQSLIGEYYVDCEVGKADEEIPEGGTIPVERTSSSIPPDLIASVMRRPYRERFRLLLSELGVGLAGRPEELNEVIKRAHPALKEVNETLEILDRQNETIRDFITDADKVSAAVEPKKEQLSRWAQEAMETAEIQASRADSLQAQWNKLPTFLGELRPTLAQLDATASEQIPFLRRMHAAAPDFHRLLVGLEGFSNVSRGSTRALGEMAVVGRKALTESAEEIAELRELSEDAPRLAKPLRQFLQTIDDRERSVEDDPLHERARPTGAGQDGSAGGRGLHRHGGDPQLRLLADAGDQRLRPDEPLPAHRRPAQRLLGVPEQPHRRADRALLDWGGAVPAVHRGAGAGQGRGPNEPDPQREGPLHARGARG